MSCIRGIYHLGWYIVLMALPLFSLLNSKFSRTPPWHITLDPGLDTVMSVPSCLERRVLFHSYYRYSILFFSEAFARTCISLEVAWLVFGRYDHVTKLYHVVISGLYKPLHLLFKSYSEADC